MEDSASIAAARAICARFDVQEPWDVDVEMFAAAHGVTLLWRDSASADARVVRRGNKAYFVIAHHARGTPRARFSIAHELGHVILHPHVDGIDRIHGRRRELREVVVERQADKFAVEVLMPRDLFAPYCAAARPTFEDVKRAARPFRTSWTATARRFAALSPAACAFVESRAGVVINVARSATFRAAIARGHALGAWGAPKKRPVREESVPIRGTDRVLTWLVQE